MILTVLGVYYTNSIDDNAFDLCLIPFKHLYSSCMRPFECAILLDF